MCSRFGRIREEILGKVTAVSSDVSSASLLVSELDKCYIQISAMLQITLQPAHFSKAATL